MFLLYALFGSDLTLLGIYLPIMVVEPAIVKRMEFSDLEPVRDAFRHGFNNALGMCIVLLIVGCLRELLATGAVFGNVILHNALLPLAALPAGGFVIVGILAAIWCAAANLYTDYKHEEVRRRMLTVSTELQPILNGVVQFISYMVLAVFAENVILARALGVTRLMKLVPDHRAQVWDFCLPLLLVITLSAPAGWAARPVFPWLRDYLPAWLPISALRPIVYLTCSIAAMAVAWLLLGVLPQEAARQLPQPAQPCHLQHRRAGHDAHLREPELYDFLQSVAFALGSGLGYVFAVFIVLGEGRRRLRSRPSPRSSGSAQPFDDLHRRAVAGDLRSGWPHRCSVTVRGGRCCVRKPALPQPIFYLARRRVPLDPWAAIAVDQFTSQPGTGSAPAPGRRQAQHPAHRSAGGVLRSTREPSA